MTTDIYFYTEDYAKDYVKRYVSRGIWGVGTDKTFEDNSTPMAVLQDGKKMIAGIIFHNYDPDFETIEFSCYARNKNWLNRKILNKILRYPFEELGLRIVTARFSEDNTFIEKIVKRLNATTHRLPELWGVNKDQIFAILKADDWRKSELYSI